MTRFLALSFVTRLPGRGAGLNWWDVKPSGDYAPAGLFFCGLGGSHTGVEAE